MMNKQQPADSTWYRLDNSAKIYPAIMSDRQSTLFRIAFTLNDIIDPETLQQALENIHDRYPFFNVTLRKGLFWNYLEKNTEPCSIHCDTPSPCENINAVYYNGYLYKVLYFKNRIATEFSHVMTDGYGGLEFIKSLVMEYLRLCGHNIQNDGSIIEPDSQIDPMELSDDHKRYSASPDYPAPPKNERNLFGDIKAFQTKGRQLPLREFNIITGITNISDLKSLAKNLDVTITELLAAVYLESLIDIQKLQVKNPKNYASVAVQVPVNMRNMLESKSMRNFSLFVTPTLNPPDFPDFEGLLDFVKTFIRESIKIDKMMQIMRDNVSVGENIFVRHIPLILKLPITKYIVNTQGSSQHSGTLSNLGLVKLPPSMAKHIDSVTVNIGPDPHSKASCAMVGYEGKIYITFGRIIKDAIIERHFFRRLRRLGIPIKIQSNC